MKTEKTNKLVRHTFGSLFVLGFGILIMVYGIIVEDEPTAVALLMIMAGITWFFVTLFRLRSKNRTQ